MAMDLEPRINQDQRKQVSHQQEEEHQEVEGMTERAFKSHDIQYSPLKVFAAAVLILMFSGAIVGLIYWTYSRATGGG